MLFLYPCNIMHRMDTLHGPYIVIEGLDGSGKDTQADLLCAHFREMGLNPLRLNEPDADLPIGKLLRQLLKSGEYPEAHAPLFLADRMVMLVTKVIPAIREDRPVVSSRSFLSTLVYQQDQWPLEWLLAIHEQLPAKPNRVIILDMNPEEALKRVAARPGHLEIYERVDIQRRNRDRYRELAEDYRLERHLAPRGWIAVCDASGTPETVHNRVWGLVASLIG